MILNEKGDIFMEEKLKIRPESSINKIYDPDIVVSATDSTGLIPTPPQSVDEAESYTEIYDIPQPQVKNEGKHYTKKKGLPH